MLKKGITRFSMETLLSHSSENFRRGTLLCFTKFLMSKKIIDKRGGRVSRFSVEKSLSHSADKFRGITLLGFQRILVSKSFKQKRGQLHGFVEKFFYLTIPKKIRQGTILCFRKLLVGKNILWIRRGVYHDIPWKFLSHCTEIIHWRTLWCFRRIPLSKLFMHRRGRGITVVSKFSRLTVPKTSVREFYCFRENFWFQKVLRMKRGVSRFSVENFWPHSA